MMDISVEELKSIIKEGVREAIGNLGFKMEVPTKSWKEILSPVEAAAMLTELGYPISKSSIYQFVSNNEIDYKKFGPRVVFDRDSVIAWAEKRLKQPRNNQDALDSIVRSARKKATHIK